MKLRDYQEMSVEAVRDRYRAGKRRTLLVLPTGGGKTVCFSYIASGVAQNNKRVLIIAHRRELLRQISKALTAVGVPHGMLMGGSTGIPRTNVVVASVFTLANRLKHFPEPDMIIGDEAHHFTPNSSWGKVVNAFPKARVLGVTATPERLDGKGLGVLFDDMVVGPTVAELTEQGFLSPADVYAPSKPDMQGIHTRMGDFVKADLEKVMDRPSITGSAVAHYTKLAAGKKAIAFCVSVKHAQMVAEDFRNAGYASYHIDGGMTEGERDKVLKDFEAGKIQVLTSCDLVSEGFDLPAVEVAILLRPTQSLSLYLQQCGRAIRPAPGKDCLSSGTKILTQRGEIPIEKVSIDDLLWDGYEWVSHGGVVYKGFKDVIEYNRLTATEDHQVWTQEGWRSFGECARQQIPIVEAGFGGMPLRICRNNIPSGKVGGEKMEQKNACPNKMLRMQGREMGLSWKLTGWQDKRLQSLQSTNQISEMALHQNAECAAALLQSQLFGVDKLRRTWNHVRLYVSSGRGALGARKSGTACQSKIIRTRSHRQRQRLRSGEYKVVNAVAECISYKAPAKLSENALVQIELPGCKVRGRDLKKNVQPQHTNGADSRSILQPPIDKTKREVWDILNSGPRNCFTAEGFLVHNCTIILDHAGNTARHGFIDEPREWTLDPDIIKQRRAAAKEKPPEVRTCPTCFAVHATLPMCPKCGHVYELKGRQILELDGELVQLSNAHEARSTAEETDWKRRFDVLTMVGRKRGYKSPQKWAYNVICGQEATRLAKLRNANQTTNGLTLEERQRIWTMTMGKTARA
jgi:hypothetical protein